MDSVYKTVEYEDMVLPWISFMKNNALLCVSDKTVFSVSGITILLFTTLFVDAQPSKQIIKNKTGIKFFIPITSLYVITFYFTRMKGAIKNPIHSSRRIAKSILY